MSTTRPWTFGGDPVGDYQKHFLRGLTDPRELARHFRVDISRVLTTRVYRSDATGQALSNGTNPQWIVAVVRADQQIDEARLDEAAREHFCVGIVPTPLNDPALREKWPVGYIGPEGAMALVDAVLLIDPDAAQSGPWITGANDVDFQAENFNWFRECGDRLADPRKTVVVDIRRETPT